MDVISFQLAKKALDKAGNVGDKQVDLKDLVDGSIIRYDEEADIFVIDRQRAIAPQWVNNESYNRGEIVIFDDMAHWVIAEDYVSHPTDIERDIADGKIIPLATELGVGNVLFLEYDIEDEGEEIVVTWENPDQTTYEGRDVYFSSSIDITPLRRVDLQEMVDNGEDVELISSGLGSGQGEAESLSLSAELRKEYYIKIFTEHYVDEETQYSSGRFLTMLNPDIYPPAPPTNVKSQSLEDSILLTWTQPEDDDFFHTRIVRSKIKMPTTPTDGTVLGSVSGDGVFEDTDVDEDVVYYYKLFSYDDAGEDGMQYGEEGNWNSSEDSEIEAKIVPVYGFDLSTGERFGSARDLEQDEFDNIEPWSGMSRAIVDSNGEVVYYLDDENSEYQDGGVEPAVLDGSEGNIVVEIPEFYFARIGDVIQISPEEFDGAEYQPRTLIGAFEASEITEGELSSVPDVDPLTGKSMSEYRELVSNIGNGWTQNDMKTLNALKMLFLIEYGAFNSQELIGEGIVDSEEPIQTGSTLSLGNSTGVASNGAVSYRGIENPWGNIWEFIEGFVITDQDYYIADEDFGSFVGDSNTGSYQGINITPITENGFISKFAESLYLIGSEVQGNSETFVGDHQFSHGVGETNYGVHGGNYLDGERAGLFRMHMGVKKFAKEDEMDLIDTINFYTEEEMETENNVVGELRDENIEIELGGSGVEGNVYTIDFHKQLTNDEVHEIKLIELISDLPENHKVLIQSDNGEVIDMDFAEGVWEKVADEYSEQLFESYGFEGEDMSDFVGEDWAELYSLFTAPFNLIVFIEDEGDIETPVIRQQNVEYIMETGFVYEKELSENELEEIKGIAIY